jgi:hypothetical protein
MIATQHPEVSFCPILVPLVRFFLCAFDAEETYLLCLNMIKRSLENEFYFPVSANSFHRHCVSFALMAGVACPRLSDHLVKLKVNTSRLFELWLRDGFLGFLHETTRNHLMDAFLEKGAVVHINAGLSTLRNFYIICRGSGLSADGVHQTLSKFAALMGPHCLLETSASDLNRGVLSQLNSSHVFRVSQLSHLFARQVDFRFPRLPVFTRTLPRDELAFGLVRSSRN